MSNQDNQWHLRCNGIKKAEAKRILDILNAPNGFMVDYFVESFHDNYNNLRMNMLLVDQQIEEVTDEIKILEEKLTLLKMKQNIFNAEYEDLMNKK